MTNVDFSSTPPNPYSHTRILDHESVAEQLKSRPNQWAQVFPKTEREDALRTIAHQIKGGVYKAYPKGQFEAVSRKGEDGVVGLWVRYIGKKTRTTKR